MTEIDSDITRDDRDEIVITKGYKSITSINSHYNTDNINSAIIN